MAPAGRTPGPATRRATGGTSRPEVYTADQRPAALLMAQCIGRLDAQRATGRDDAGAGADEEDQAQRRREEREPGRTQIEGDHRDQLIHGRSEDDTSGRTRDDDHQLAPK